MSMEQKPNNILDEISQYNFSGHETFPFRYTWLPKGVQKLQQHSDLFTREDGMVILGVGKNMVRSIRHWCETLELITSPHRGEYETTPLGENLFCENGWDPYLENPGTLWLLHWNLASRFDRSSTWYLTFTRWAAPRFTREQLLDWIYNQVKNISSIRTTRNSLKRDIDVFIRTYTPSKIQREKISEDTFDCPLVDLGLISQIDNNSYLINKGPQPSLPQDIFIYALIKYWEKRAPDQNTLAFENVLYSPGSLGRVFCLNDNSLYDRLINLPSWTGISYDDTAGMRVLYRNRKNDGMKVLANFYENYKKE